jgi:site-specific recombinase XerD
VHRRSSERTEPAVVRTPRSALRLEQLTEAWLAGIGSARTREAYRGDLAAFVAWCAAEGRSPLVGDPDVERYRDACEADGAEASTIARRLSALASFYDHALAERAVESNPVDGVERPLQRRSSSGSPLGEQQALDLLDAALELGPKVAVLVALLLLEGLKLGEALALDVEELDGSGWAMRATVLRRGRRQVITLDGRTAQAIAALLDGRLHGPLLVGDSATRDAAAPPPRLTRFGAAFLLKRAAEAAGIDRPVSANTLRHSHISLAHRGGAAVEDIRDRVGHANVRDTRRFLG